MNKFSQRFYPFLDPIKRPSDKPFSQEDGISDNPLLFSGEGLLLLSLLGRLEKSDIAFCDNALVEVEVTPGLYRRQPAYYQDQYKIPMNAISHDEYNGICFMVAASPEFFRSYALDIVNYGERYSWQYNDIAPRANFFEALKDNPIKTIKELRAYLKDNKENPHDTNSVDLRHPPHIIALGQWRQPRDRAFYKIAAGIEPSLFEIINLALATIFSSLGDPFKSRGGTKLMAWFRMLAVRRLNGEGLLLRVAHAIFERNLTKKLGIDYPYKLISNYFDRDDNGLRHPLIMLVKEYLELQKTK